MKSEKIKKIEEDAFEKLDKIQKDYEIRLGIVTEAMRKAVDEVFLKPKPKEVQIEVKNSIWKRILSIFK